MDYVIPDGIYDARRRLRSVRHRVSGVPPADEKRLVADEVLVEIAKSLSPQAIEAMQRRHRLIPIRSQKLQLTGTTVYHCRIADKRTVAVVVRALEADANVASAQPNYIFTLRQDQTGKDKKRREFAELRLKQSHSRDSKANTPVAVMDSWIDSPLAGSPPLDVADGSTPDQHASSIASLVVRDGRLAIEAPSAHIPAHQAFDPERSAAEGRTFDILKALDLATTKGARVTSIGFAGPFDPVINRNLEAVRKRDMGLAAIEDADPKAALLDPVINPIRQ